MRHWTWVLLAAALAGCAPSKSEIVKQSEGLHAKSDLEHALGRPAALAKFGPLEQWTYHAKDGDVVFLITGDTVALLLTDDHAR